MAIKITKRPYTYCFSGNPVHYELYSAAAALDPTISFEVLVSFTSSGGNVKETEAFEYSPINGYAEVDIQSILEGLLEYELPQFTGPETTIWPAPAQSGWFYIRFREITEQNANPSWDASEMDFMSFVVKGGLSRFKYQGNNFFTNYFNADTPRVARPFLTWQKSGRLAYIGERMYLAYLLIDQVEENNLSLKARVTYTDGSFADHAVTMPVERNRVYYLPAGAKQWEFSTVKQIWFWEIWVEDVTLGDTAILSTVFRYDADNRHDYNDITLHYRNSLCGLDSVRVRGVIEYNQDYEFQEVQKTVRPDYFSGHYFDPQKTVDNNKEIQVLRGDIGHLDKEEQDRLRDAFLKRETWKEVAKKWWPINIITKSIKQKKSDDTLWSLPIDFTLAHDGDTAYTPESVDLGVGTFTSNVCRAFLGNVGAAVANGPAGYKTVTISFLEIDPDDASNQIKWRVIKQLDNTEVLPWTTIPFASPVVFNLPENELYVWEARAICSNAIQGQKHMVNVNTNQNSTGTGDSRVVNNKPGACFFKLYRNGVALINNAYLGGNASYPFDCAAGLGVVIVFETAFYSPSSATISNGTVTLNGVIVNNAGLDVTVTFPPIDITDGVTITLD